MAQMRQHQYLPHILQSTCRWAEVSLTRSGGGILLPLITMLFSYSTAKLTINAFKCLLGSGHWHAYVVHPGLERAEKHPSSDRADPCCSGCDRPGDLHVHVWQLWRCNKSGSRPGPAPLYADCRLGHRGLHVRILPTQHHVWP